MTYHNFYHVWKKNHFIVALFFLISTNIVRIKKIFKTKAESQVDSSCALRITLQRLSFIVIQ